MRRRSSALPRDQGFHWRAEGGEATIRRERPNVVLEQKGNERPYGEPRDAALARLRAWGMRPLAQISGDWILGW